MSDNYQTLLQCLIKASSQKADFSKAAETHLKDSETNGGFFSTLLDIATDCDLYINTRLLSVLYIKNRMHHYWRNSICIAEKEFIKEKLLASLSEPINQIALQLAVIIARIARQDFPDEWQDLFPTLISAVQSSDELTQLRALLALHHVVKILASKRFTWHVKIFEQLTVIIFSTIFHQWINFSKLFLEGVQSDISGSKQFLEKAFLCLKILRKLIVYGFKNCSENADAVNFLSLIFTQFRPFLECRVILGDCVMLKLCEKYIVLLVKILRNILVKQPLSFIQFIQRSLECSINFCFNNDFQGFLYERLIVQFLNLVKDILLCTQYKPSEFQHPSEQSLVEEADKIKVKFFTAPVLTEICQQLLSRYFLLSENDLRKWENNPEEFESDKAGESWEYSLHPCTEVFFLSLFREFRELLIPIILEFIKCVQNDTTYGFTSVLQKEAMYNAVGLAAFDLHDEIDFDNWFTNILIPALRVNETGYYILRRRVIWLIGQWVGVKMSSDLRPLLYQVILQLLNSDENLVVRLAAANTLRTAIDDFDFKEDQFLPFLECSISSLFMLLREVKECDLKMPVLHVMSFIIERMRMEVHPHVNSLMQYLPQLWQSCGEHNMLRCAIISCFVQLVKSLQKASEALHSSLLPMIALCTDVSEPPDVYLLKDGLQLWLTVLQNTSEPSPQLLDLAANLMPLLEYRSENLIIALQVTETYIVLCRENFLERYGQIIVKTFGSAVNDLKSEAVNKILKVIETAVTVFPNDAPVLFEPLLLFTLNQVYMPDELPLSLTVYFSLLSRVILYNKKCFGNILQKRAMEFHTDVQSVLGSFLDIWLKKIPLLNSLPKKRLIGFALTRLLTSGFEFSRNYMSAIYLTVVDVLNDVTSHNEDLIVLANNDLTESYSHFVCEHEKRMLQIYRADPILSLPLQSYFCSEIKNLQEIIGVVNLHELMSGHLL